MAGFGLGDIISQAAAMNATQTQQASEVAGMYGQMQDSSNKMAGMLSEAGTLTAQAELVKQQGELETQKARVTAANAFGTNVNDVSDIITQLGLTARETGIQFLAAQDKVTQIEANSDLLTNPLGWLHDLVGGDAARAERDALGDKFKNTLAVAEGLNKETQDTVQTQNAISETLTAASIQDNAKATQLLADAKAEEAKIQGARYGADSINLMREVGAQNYGRGLQAYQMALEDQRYKEGAAMRREQFEAMREARKSNKQTDEHYAVVAERANLYAASAGLQPVTTDDIKNAAKFGGAIDAKYREYERLGFDMQQRGSTMNMYGDNAVETSANLLRTQPDLPPSYSTATDLLSDGMNSAGPKLTEAVIANGNKALNAQQQASIVNKAAIDYAKAEKAEIKHGKGNAYEALSISTVLAEQSNGLAASNFGQKVLQTLSATGQDNPSLELLMATGLSMLDKGEIKTMAELVKGTNDFYASSNAIKDTTQGFKEMGLPVAGPEYNVRLNVLQASGPDVLLNIRKGAAIYPRYGELVGNTTPVGLVAPINAISPTDITTAYAVMQSQKKANEIRKAAKQSQ